MLSAVIFAYAAAAPVNGFFGGSFYSKFGGRQWIKVMFWSALFLPTLVCGTAFLINFISMYYHASRTIHFGSMVSVSNLNVNNYSAFHSVGCGQYLSVYYLAVDIGRNCARPQHVWCSQQSLPGECGSSPDSREEVVHGTFGDYPSWWHLTIWVDLHRNVLHFHQLLGI